MKESNPVDNVNFYSDKELDFNKFSLPRESISLLIPNFFQERILRIYTRDLDKKLDMQRTFSNFLQRNSLI